MPNPYPLSKPFAKTKVDLPPCSLKFHPLNNNIVLLGTYKYDETTKLKTGSIDVLEYNNSKNSLFASGDGASSLMPNYGDDLRLLYSISTDTSVLDLQFSPFDDNLFATAQSKGLLALWKTTLSEDAVQPIKIEKVTETAIFESNVLITSLRFSDTNDSHILVTATSGETALVKITPRTIETQSYFAAQHSIEAWIGNFGNFNDLANVTFTGGDDLQLIANDIRAPEDGAVFQTGNLHSAGITSILTATPGDHRGNGAWLESGACNQYQLYTGGYDDLLKISDLRYLTNEEDSRKTLLPYPPKCVQSIDLGGGVWKLIPFKKQQDSAKKSKLLACCMYDGAKILDVDTVNSKVEIDRVLKKNHKSMVYGGDTSFPNNNNNKAPFMGTCSFYDCSIQIWSPELLDQEGGE